jgi:hypothetical protein
MPDNHTIVRNKSNATIKCRISASNALAADAQGWADINAHASKTYECTGWELITFKNEAGTTRGATCADLTQPKLVEFHAYDKILVF